MWVFNMWDTYQTTLGNNLQMPRPIHKAKKTYGYLPSARAWYRWDGADAWTWISVDDVPKQYLAASLLLT